MNAHSKLGLSLTAGIGAFGLALFGGNPVPPDLRLINQLDDAVQRRFQDPMPAQLGMSRVIIPNSFGEHFRPNPAAQRDFEPENPAEKEVIAALEGRHIQVGFYLMGAAIGTSDPALVNFRALKGPGAMTSGTPRPSSYPPLAKLAPATPDTLPDWYAIYPMARDAMKHFQEGGNAFETTIGNWRVAARPVVASQQRCVTCHNNQAYKPVRLAKAGQPIGGVLYVFRTAPQARSVR